MAEKVLLLLRHGQALANHPLSNDTARPLSPAGRAGCGRLGHYLVRQKLVPQLVLCSSATRARETWEALSDAFEKAPQVELLESLYGASPYGMLQLIKGAPKETGHLMVIAHNPGIAALARSLAGPDSNPMELEKMQHGYGPGDLAVITQPDRSWRDIAPGQARLTRYLPNAELPEVSP